MNTGKISARYLARRNEVLEVIDDRYLLIQRPDELNTGGYAASVETVFYDTQENRTIWTLKGRASKGIIDGSTVYLAIDGLPTAVDIESGSILWQIGSNDGEDERSLIDVSSFASSSYGLLGSNLLLPYGKDLLLIQKRDGKVLGRIEDMTMGYAELRDQETRQGTLNIVGDEIYIGFANGNFTRFSKDMIEE